MNSMNYEGLSLDRIASIRGLRHPLTGELLHPLGRRSNGQLIWPGMGGSDDAGDDSGSNNGDTDGVDGSKEQDSSGNSSDNDENNKDGKKKPEPGSEAARIAALEDEKERQYTRRKEAESRAEKAEAELKELRDKDLPEVEKLKADHEAAVAENKDLTSTLKQTMLDKAFLEDNTYQWHNPSRALQVVDLSRVEFDSDGKVSGLKEALEALAKSDPYLIKPEEKTSDEDDDKDTKKTHKTGDQKNNKKDSEAVAAKRAKLVEQFPGLRR